MDLDKIATKGLSSELSSSRSYKPQKKNPPNLSMLFWTHASPPPRKKTFCCILVSLGLSFVLKRLDYWVTWVISVTWNILNVNLKCIHFVFYSSSIYFMDAIIKIIHGSCYLYSQPDIIDAFPFLELEQLDGETGAQKLAKLTCPQRVIKCHLPYELMKDNVERRPNMKIIQTLRNPKDCLVSYYHHMRADEFTGPYNGTWDQYFEL